jgi:hypothetical protein
VVVAIITGSISGVLWLMRRRRVAAISRQVETIAALRKYLPHGEGRPTTKNKKRQDDGILLANVAFDFLNQFPLPVAVLAEHVDRIYTPENFGASDWLTVFRRLTEDGCFTPVRERSARRIGLESLLNPGPKLASLLQIAIHTKRGVAGLDE